MGFWPGKFVIGLTGSIGTGKSVIRHMLEQMGALGVDADTLAHRVYARGTTGIGRIRETFGEDVITLDGEVDRLLLARRVFQDGQAMEDLERIVHPLVIDLVNDLIERAPQKVIVVEAIKLLETELASHCDAVWVVATSPEVQLQRLVQDRHMSTEAARARIDAQLSQEKRIRHASAVITNDGSLADTWQQVSAAWENTIPAIFREDAPISRHVTLSLGEGEVAMARTGDAVELREFFSNSDILAGEDPIRLVSRSTLFLLRIDNRIRACLMWNAENLVACTQAFHVNLDLPADEVFRALFVSMEVEARRRLCEVSIFPYMEEVGFPAEVLIERGYEPSSLAELERAAWREQVQKTMPSAKRFYFKPLP